jgi:hypothetical protein
MYSDSTVHPGGLALMALDYQGGYQPNVRGSCRLKFEIRRADPESGSTVKLVHGFSVKLLGQVPNFGSTLWISPFRVASGRLSDPNRCLQMHFEVVRNSVSDVTGGLGVLIDGNPANMSLSHGHVVRDNSVRGHRSPPTEFSNFDGAIPLACHCVPISTERAQRYIRSSLSLSTSI